MWLVWKRKTRHACQSPKKVGGVFTLRLVFLHQGEAPASFSVPQNEGPRRGAAGGGRGQAYPYRGSECLLGRRGCRGCRRLSPLSSGLCPLRGSPAAPPPSALQAVVVEGSGGVGTDFIWWPNGWFPRDFFCSHFY